MPQWEIFDEDGDKYTGTFPKYINGRLGRKAFNKLDLKVENGQPTVGDVSSTLECKEFIVDQMMEKSDIDLSTDELAMPSFNKIANYYFEQIMGAEEKKSS